MPITTEQQLRTHWCAFVTNRVDSPPSLNAVSTIAKTPLHMTSTKQQIVAFDHVYIWCQVVLHAVSKTLVVYISLQTARSLWQVMDDEKKVFNILIARLNSLTECALNEWPMSATSGVPNATGWSSEQELKNVFYSYEKEKRTNSLTTSSNP